ncbi:hypothetical protein CPS_1293 [Colwellia psychrerythraea 34H]|uniref:Uncharacterized protein n=1 Tax=Colwellia psychrerythraea (strain 34H / ATCC BAA-681) TaxID=167879 RepID=Q486H9_COLP3|nr:hypothetical protein CPS_1293 [Colwellia psychrerythraea 34H]
MNKDRNKCGSKFYLLKKYQKTLQIKLEPDFNWYK